MIKTSTQQDVVMIRLPQQLKNLIKVDNALIAVPHAQTFNQLFKNLAEKYPALAQYFFDEAGDITLFISFFLNAKPVQREEMETLCVEAGDEVEVVLSLAGG